MRPAILLVIAALLATGCGRPATVSEAGPLAAPPGRPAPSPPAAPTWKVVSVHDGDTLRAIDQANVQRKIRLVGIDAPELGQPFGRAARERLGDLTLGQAVVVQLRDRDRYGRDLATLVVDGADVNRQLVAEGLAWHFTRYSDDADLAAAEAAARDTRRGLWADPAPVPPWAWRAGEAERKREPAGR